MKGQIKELLQKAIEELKTSENWPDFEMPEIEVDYPKNEAFGDYTTNIAMVLAKVVKKNPMEIADRINQQLTTYPEKSLRDLRASNLQQFEKTEAVKPGYINFHLSKDYLQNLVEEINYKKGDYGNLDSGQKIMVEYSQPNTHKEFHVGHLRNVILGNALVNILRKAGQNVTAANYIGDTGTHVAKILWGLNKYHKDVNWDDIENKTEFLGKVYSESVQKIEENEEFKNEFKQIQKKFEEGDTELNELWRKTRRFSLDDFSRIYEKLGVSFDVYFYESEAEKDGKKMIPELLATEIIRKSQGALIADLEKYNLGVLVLERSDGAALYGIKDIPLAMKKFKEFDIEKSIYIVDVRQELYFRQLFKILNVFGFEKEMVHIGYDFVTLKSGEGMSSRKGNIIPADCLMEKVKNKVDEKFPESPNSEEISLGALKIFMLKYSSKSIIEFDVDESVRLEGNTGPYVQYAYARISSILKKAEEKGFKLDENSKVKLMEEKELALVRKLNKFPELIEEIATTYEVHKLPYYAISLADSFHSFYNDLTVIDEGEPEITAARLKLVNAVRIVLGETLRLIGVSAPDKM